MEGFGCGYFVGELVLPCIALVTEYPGWLLYNHPPLYLSVQPAASVLAAAVLPGGLWHKFSSLSFLSSYHGIFSVISQRYVSEDHLIQLSLKVSNDIKLISVIKMI